MAKDASIATINMIEHFGRYRLESMLGEGSLAEVYRARREGEGEGEAAVALKRLAAAHVASEAMRSIFERESAISASLSGQGLLSAHDSGVIDDWPYLAMPLATGGSLNAAIDAQSGLPRSRLAPLARDLSTALSSLHSQGFLHCDLSPRNVLFDDSGQALLCDFSASTAVGSRQLDVQGSFAYMSPEQVRGTALGVSSDVFSLALLLWQCTTGESIFWREAQHLSFMAVVESSPPPMSPPLAAVEAVLVRALAKGPQDRYQTPDYLCSAFVAALGEAEQPPIRRSVLSP